MSTHTFTPTLASVWTHMCARMHTHTHVPFPRNKNIILGYVSLDVCMYSILFLLLGALSYVPFYNLALF